MAAFFHGGTHSRNFADPRAYRESLLSWRDFQRIWRRMPRVSSASLAERRRRWTRRRIFSSGGAAERRFCEPLGGEFKKPLERRPSRKREVRRPRTAAGAASGFSG